MKSWMTLTATALMFTGLMAGQTIRDRQENQQQRIGQGVANGSLTPREATRLEQKEAALNREIRHDRRDGGRLTPQERRKIARQQNSLSRQIHRQKTDDQHRPQ